MYLLYKFINTITVDNIDIRSLAHTANSRINGNFKQTYVGVFKMRILITVEDY